MKKNLSFATVLRIIIDKGGGVMVYQKILFG